MTRPDPRVALAIEQTVIHRQGIKLTVREWVDIPRWSEFRLFMKDRVFLGVSQYFHSETFPDIEQNLERIRPALVDFCRTFRDACHMDTVVVDVFLEARGGALKARLIELNPWGLWSDSCLYSWEENDFDGRLRFRKGERILTVSLA